MKITKESLKQIIKEEMQKRLAEADVVYDLANIGGPPRGDRYEPEDFKPTEIDTSATYALYEDGELKVNFGNPNIKNPATGDDIYKLLNIFNTLKSRVKGYGLKPDEEKKYLDGLQFKKVEVGDE